MRSKHKKEEAVERAVQKRFTRSVRKSEKIINCKYVSNATDYTYSKYIDMNNCNSVNI